MTDQRMIVGAIEAVNVHAVYVVGLGWSLEVGARRQFQSWAEASRGSYERLSTEELVDVLEAVLSLELLGPQPI